MSGRGSSMDGPGRPFSGRWVLALIAGLVALGGGFFSAPRASSAPAMAAAVDIYQYAGECRALRDRWSGRYVSRDLFGYSLKFRASEATPFRMQATALGRYLLFGPDESMPAAGIFSRIVAEQEPGPAADWRLASGIAGISLTNVQSTQSLSVSGQGRLEQTQSPEPRWSLEPATGCADFPEVEVNVEGVPSGPAGAEARGFLDAHVHVTAFDFLGGRFHCGRPWSPYGVTVALKDCPDHALDHKFALAENLLSEGALSGDFSTDGWPDFDGWPRYDSLTHEGTYWKGIERAWRAGLRIMVADLVENRALCELYPLKQNPCTDMASMRLQARDLQTLQDYIDAQYKGPGKGFFRIVKSPAEARAVIGQGKLAVVMAVETSQPFDCLYQNGVELCTRNQIDRGLRELWSMGVRSMFVVHKFDNAFGGTAMDSDAESIFVNIGNKWMTGRWWEVEPCSGPDHDQTPLSLTQQDASQMSAVLADGSGGALYDNLFQAIFDGPLPSYPSGPLCNVRGLTDLGRYLVNRMIDMGMIVETDHMSVKTRDQALAILEARHYSGVITSHSWGDESSQRRIQALGGVVAVHVNPDRTHFIAEWQKAKQDQPAGFYFGLGFGSDMNGISVQAGPRSGPNPVTYPFSLLDAGVTIDQNKWGSRLWDFKTDGVAQYGLYADWVEDVRLQAGQGILDDLARGAEAYLQMWERAGPQSP